MPEPTKPRIRLGEPEFPGLVTNADPKESKTGAVIQENLHCNAHGELQGRGGLREVQFDN